MSYALITGASKGIGKEIALQLAERGYNLLLVARNSYELQMVKEEIQKKYSLEVDYLVSDLADSSAISTLYEWVLDKQIDLRILVNNAGYGLVGEFEKIPFHYHDRMKFSYRRNICVLAVQL